MNGNGAGAHESLAKNLVIEEAGYVYIYLSDESETPVDVFFDDFSVEQVKGPVVQMGDYYPFGLTYNLYSRENSVLNKYRFQGQEHIDDLNLGWDSFKWRNHMPEIGRFFNVDPLSEKYYYNSLYAFSENKVVAHRELEGLESKYYMGSNPLTYMTEGFRQYFDNFLSLFSFEGKVYTNVSGATAKGSSGNLSVSTSTSTETKAYVKVDLSGVMDNNGNNTPSAPKIDAGTKTAVTQTTEVKVTVNPAGIPINIAASNTMNATDQTVTNKVEASVGVSEGAVQGKVYVNNSSTTQLNGATENKTSVGGKVEAPVYNDGQRKVSIGAQVELTHKH